MLPLVHSEVQILSCKVLLRYTLFSCIFTQNLKEMPLKSYGDLWCFLRSKFCLVRSCYGKHFFLVYSRKILKYATEIVASGAFWGPNFVLQCPTKVYICFVYSRNVLKKSLKCWPLCILRSYFLSCKVLLMHTFCFVYSRNWKIII